LPNANTSSLILVFWTPTRKTVLPAQAEAGLPAERDGDAPQAVAREADADSDDDV
jgi:hypothetical protein